MGYKKSKKFKNVVDFDIYIHDYESIDTSTNRENIIPYMELGTLFNAASLDASIFYDNYTRDIYHMIDDICRKFNVNKELLKRQNSDSYKPVPQKYWGIIFFCLRCLYSEYLPFERTDNLPPKRSYLYILKRKIAYKTITETEEQELISDFVIALEEYINNCIATKEQFLFQTRNGEDKSIPFYCMRYLENEYIYYYLNNVKDNTVQDDAALKIIEEFKDMESLKSNMDKPKVFEKILSEKPDEFQEMWKSFLTKLKKRNDYPKSSNNPKVFCETEFDIILEGLTQRKALEGFYSRVKTDYIDKLNKLQAIVDMDYVVHLYDDDIAKQLQEHTERVCREISDVIDQKYLELADEFKDYILGTVIDTENEPDDLKKFIKALRKWIAFNALSENEDLCRTINNNDKNVEITYNAEANTTKSKGV